MMLSRANRGPPVFSLDVIETMATEVEPPPGMDRAPEAAEDSEEGALCDVVEEVPERAESPEPNPDLEDGEIDDDEEDEESKELRPPKGDCNHNESDAGEVQSTSPTSRPLDLF